MPDYQKRLLRFLQSVARQLHIFLSRSPPERLQLGFGQAYGRRSRSDLRRGRGEGCIGSFQFGLRNQAGFGERLRSILRGAREVQPAGRLLLRQYRLRLGGCHSQCFRDTASVSRIGFREVLNLQSRNTFGNALHVPGQVADERLLRIRGHQAKKIAGLRVIVVAVSVVEAVDFAGNFVRQFAVARVKPAIRESLRARWRRGDRAWRNRDRPQRVSRPAPPSGS